MKITNRALSFVIVAIVYVVATAIGVVSYIYLPFDFWLNLLFADVIATIVTFVFSLVFRNASVYDPYWSVQPIVIVVAYAVAGKSMGIAQILPLIAVLLWGIRLTANWAYTFGGLQYQDWRYTMLCEKTGKAYPLVNFLGIHLVPTLVVYGCVLPIVFTFEYSSDIVLNTAKIVGISVFFALSIGAVIMQGVADCQMHKFRKNRTGPFIRTGLWKYSRHPNYLGEILMWWGVALSFVCIMPNRWYLIAGAVANTLLFVCVSIPLADGRQSRKEGFAEYKAQTRMLLPIWKKNSQSEK